MKGGNLKKLPNIFFPKSILFESDWKCRFFLKKHIFQWFVKFSLKTVNYIIKVSQTKMKIIKRQEEINFISYI